MWFFSEIPNMIFISVSCAVMTMKTDKYEHIFCSSTRFTCFWHYLKINENFFKIFFLPKYSKLKALQTLRISSTLMSFLLCAWLRYYRIIKAKNGLFHPMMSPRKLSQRDDLVILASRLGLVLYQTIIRYAPKFCFREKC